MTALPKKTPLIFAGGGTGGHLFPAIAIANRVSELLAGKAETKIEFVGTKRGIEYRLRDSIGYPLRLVNIRGIARSLTLKNLAVPFLVIGSLMKSRSILKEMKPHVVVGTGGYVSWPILKMASMMGITTVLQEQNSFPGISTRRLAASAARVYLGFEEGKSFLPSGAATMTTGNPVRRTIADGNRIEALEHFGLDANRKTILVLGGSQGARSINEAIQKSLKDGSLTDNYQLLWQTGKGDYTDISSSLDEKEALCAFPFDSEMERVYAAADLVIARAGAITLAELEACNLPAILIPYPYAAGDHQRKNAQAYVSRGFGKTVDPNDLDSVDILAEAIALFEDGKVDKMRSAIAQETAGRKPAVDIIAEDIIKLIGIAQEKTVAD